MNKWIIAILAGVIIVGGIIAYDINDKVNKDTIYPGISIASTNVSGKTKEEAFKDVKETQERELEEKTITLKGQDKEYILNLKDLDFVYDYQQAVDEAYSSAREGNIFQRYIEVKKIQKNNITLALETRYDDNKIKEKVTNVASEINAEAVNSEFGIIEGEINITDEKDGYKLDETKLNAQIQDNIYKLEDIEMPIEVIKPEITKEYYSKINGVIGEATTTFNSSGPGRVHNIKLSARAFDGRMVKPGEDISYNSTLGPVNSKSGYQNAPVIVAGDLTPGVGGGICQTSTTLYNALLRADLTVTERSHHSIPSAYMAKGLDAVVAGDFLDLKFKNDFDYPIYISTAIVGKSVTFKIYGDKDNMDYTVEMQPKITNVIPHKVTQVVKSNLKPGTKKLEQEGRDGYKVTTYKHKVKDGKVIETKTMSTDYYRERDTVYHIGPKEEKKEPVAQAPVAKEPEAAKEPAEPVEPAPEEAPEETPAP